MFQNFLEMEEMSLKSSIPISVADIYFPYPIQGLSSNYCISYKLQICYEDQQCMEPDTRKFWCRSVYKSIGVKQFIVITISSEIVELDTHNFWFGSVCPFVCTVVSKQIFVITVSSIS